MGISTKWVTSCIEKPSAKKLIAVIVPATAFVLGTWQVQRLKWKTNLITKFEDRLLRPPLPLPPTIDPEAISEFDYRRIEAKGYFRHDQEILLGPRIHDGKNGFLVVTPLEREDGASKVLVKRGWIPKEFLRQKDRLPGLPTGKVIVKGLLREPTPRNMVSPINNPENGQWHFPDVQEMAEFTGSSPVWIEETMEQNLLEAYDRMAVGKPIGRPAQVNLRNNHVQYIFTWYSLSAATAVMFWMVLRKPPSAELRKLRNSPRY